MVSLNSESQLGEKAAAEAVQSAAFHAAELQEEWLVEQHFGGLSEHYAEQPQQFVPAARQFISEHPWATVAAAAGVGLLLGMITGPAVAGSARKIAGRFGRDDESAEGAGPSDEAATLEDASYYAGSVA